MADCLICRIIVGDTPAHIIWEDEHHLAFLSIYPNTEGVTLVVPKKHYSSYAFDLPDDVLGGLMVAAKKVAKLLDSKFEDVGRCGLVFEGFAIDHVHAKLFPLHGTGGMQEWRPIESDVDKYFDVYEGYISSHDHIRAEDADLAALAEKLRLK